MIVTNQLTDEDRKIAQGTGRKVRKVRKAANITQEELAEKVGATPVTISRIENGHAMPGGLLLVKMARILRVSVDAICG